MAESAPASPSVPYVRCGASGLKLPRISLGCWHNFGEHCDPAEMRRMVFRAFDLGITHFDLANNYGPPPGQAETAFGEILRHLPRNQVVIATKAGYHMRPGPYGDWGCRKYLLNSLDESLTRLGVDYVDIFYHHRPDPETPLAESMGALQQAVRSGRALYPAVSNYPMALAGAAGELLSRVELQGLIANQVRYNMLNRSLEADVAHARGLDLGVIAFSALAQGVLSARYLDGVPAGSRASRTVWDRGTLSAGQITAEIRTDVARLDAIARRRGQSLAQMSIAWMLRPQSPPITSVIVGASSVRQLEENLAALTAPTFTREELEDIDRICSTLRPRLASRSTPQPAPESFVR